MKTATNIKKGEKKRHTYLDIWGEMKIVLSGVFIIARTWKQPRCPSADEWIRKLWNIYTTEYYSAIKKNSFESGLMRWMKLEPIIQSEVSQKDKDHYNILSGGILVFYCCKTNYYKLWLQTIPVYHLTL